MSKATITIVKRDRQRVVVNNAHVTRDTKEARNITDAAIALEQIPMSDIKIAQYLVDDQFVFAYVREGGKLLLATPELPASG